APAARTPRGAVSRACGQLPGLVETPARGRAITAVILATGSDRRLSLGLAAAVAVEAAAMTDAATLLAEVGASAQRRRAPLLAAPGAREVEDALGTAGHRGSARGCLCHLALAEAGDELGELAAVIEASGAELAVAHLPGSLWVPALEQP